MKLSKEQVARFDEQGFVFVPELFSPAEVDVLMAEVAGLFAEERPQNVREKRGGVVRTTSPPIPTPTPTGAWGATRG